MCCVYSVLIIKSRIGISETSSMVFGYQVLFRKAHLSLSVRFDHIKINAWATAALTSMPRTGTIL